MDISPVDVDLVKCWIHLFLMEGSVEKAISLVTLCLAEPRFLRAENALEWIQPYKLLSHYQVGIISFHLI